MDQKTERALVDEALRGAAEDAGLENIQIHERIRQQGPYVMGTIPGTTTLATAAFDNGRTALEDIRKVAGDHLKALVAAASAT